MNSNFKGGFDMSTLEFLLINTLQNIGFDAELNNQLHLIYLSKDDSTNFVISINEEGK